ncbi:hypothetical protein AF72_05155 [Xylella taiwanensis]|uniref:Uncharacterized protein n=1 Tax=Xylella taiwanensis TaxID=1444770 RepID=Z9JKV6_9GAMM|nr:hypothetical protein AB672_02485 [Xylella taiwanensis]EWS78466.1 hypothetical protein AF72_05155 [Xylella taiwanensis]
MPRTYNVLNIATNGFEHTFAMLILAANDQQADIVFHCFVAIDQVAMPLQPLGMHDPKLV